MALTYPKRRLLGTREYLTNGTRGAYEWYSYQDVHNLAAMFAEGLKQLGFKRGDKAGIISANRTEWTVVDFACSSIGMILVPIYDSQSLDDIKYVCENAELKVIFAALDKLERIQHIKDQLKDIILFDDRVDDRAMLQLQFDKVHFERPEHIRITPRSQVIFDEFDKAEGIYDPNPVMKGYPKLDAEGNSPMIIRPDTYKIDDQYV